MNSQNQSINLNGRMVPLTMAAIFLLMLLTKSGVAVAITNADIVDAVRVSIESEYLRNNFELKNGSIKELKSQKTGESLHYCNPVSIRSKPDIASKKVGSINEGNFGEYHFKQSPHNGWAKVISGEQIVGFSAQAIRDGESINNIICPTSSWLTRSNLKLEGLDFNAELIDRRHLSIKDADGKVLYTRKVSGQTSLYEIRDSRRLFGWLVGWNKYDDSPHYNYIDFSVARVIVPYIDSNGNPHVWDEVYHGIQNAKYLNIIQQGDNKITIVKGSGLSGPYFYGCGACTWYWGLPIFVTIERSKQRIKERIENGAIDFQSVPDLPPADRFVYNWLYWNPERLGALLDGPIANQIESITSRCSPSKLAFYKHFFIPQWTWTEPLHYYLDGKSEYGSILEDQAKNTLSITEFKKYSEDAESSYETLLNYIWDSSEFIGPNIRGSSSSSEKIYDNGSEYFRNLRKCLSDNDDYQESNDEHLVTAIVGRLNLPLDIDLLKAVISQRQ